MIFDETRDNLLDIEAASIEADAHAETRDTPDTPDTRPMEHRVADGWWATLHAKAASEPDPAGVQLEAEADHIRNSRHIRLVDPREMERVADPSDPEHDPVGDADTDYDIEYDDEEGDGQPSEYEEWQDFMGGDEYYDHSENEMW
jgi:hypothetical protein